MAFDALCLPASNADEPAGFPVEFPFTSKQLYKSEYINKGLENTRFFYMAARLLITHRSLIHSKYMRK